MLKGVSFSVTYACVAESAPFTKKFFLFFWLCCVSILLSFVLLDFIPIFFFRLAFCPFLVVSTFHLCFRFLYRIFLSFLFFFRITASVSYHPNKNLYKIKIVSYSLAKEIVHRIFLRFHFSLCSFILFSCWSSCIRKKERKGRRERERKRGAETESLWVTTDCLFCNWLLFDLTIDRLTMFQNWMNQNERTKRRMKTKIKKKNLINTIDFVHNWNGLNHRTALPLSRKRDKVRTKIFSERWKRSKGRNEQCTKLFYIKWNKSKKKKKKKTKNQIQLTLVPHIIYLWTNGTMSTHRQKLSVYRDRWEPNQISI